MPSRFPWGIPNGANGSAGKPRTVRREEVGFRSYGDLLYSSSYRKYEASKLLMQLRKLSLQKQISFRRLPQSRVLFIGACDAAVTMKGECHLHLLLLGRGKFPLALCTGLFLTAEAWRRTYAALLAHSREETDASAHFLAHPGASRGQTCFRVASEIISLHGEPQNNCSWTDIYTFLILIELLF